MFAYSILSVSFVGKCRSIPLTLRRFIYFFATFLFLKVLTPQKANPLQLAHNLVWCPLNRKNVKVQIRS